LVNQSGNFKIADAVIARYDEQYNNDYGNEDVLKIVNTNENLAIKMNNRALVIDNRKDVAITDSIHLQLSAVRVQNYRWKLDVSNMELSGVMAYLYDAHKQTQQLINLNGETIIDFNVENVPGSLAPNRFTIVFKPALVLPVHFTNVTAQRSTDRAVNLQWKVENEINMEGYFVQRSSNGTQFETVSNIIAPFHNNGGAGNYTFADLDKITEDVFYRIKANSIDGMVQYSAIVKVGGLKTVSSITVYPNPVQNKQLNIQIATGVAGIYQLQLLAKNGGTIWQQSLQLNSNASTQTITLPSQIAVGHYQLQVLLPDGTLQQVPIIVL
jgi:hypothetical protein